MNLVWREGRIGGPEAPALQADDPVARGLGLFETMRAVDADVPWLDDHLARLDSSARSLGLDPFPPGRAIERAVREVIDAAGPGDWRVRVTAGDAPSLVVQLDAAPEEAAGGVSAASVRGGWLPARRLAEHKTTSYGGHLLAQRRAEAGGTEHALLLDERGRLGEAAVANVFCVVEGSLVTAPVHGLLPGIARGHVMKMADVTERALSEVEWRAASELFVTNALRGIVPVIRVDGRPVGDGTVGDRTRALRDRLRGPSG